MGYSILLPNPQQTKILLFHFGEFLANCQVLGLMGRIGLTDNGSSEDPHAVILKLRLSSGPGERPLDKYFCHLDKYICQF